MTNSPLSSNPLKGRCLTDDDLYAFLTESPGTEDSSKIQSHLSACGRCRKELAELLRVLHPEPEETADIASELSPEEIRDALELIRKISLDEQSGKGWFHWGAIAAAAVVAIGLSSALCLYLYVRIKSQTFYNQAESFLQQVYEPQSPSQLRLDLPFKPETSQRAAPSEEASMDAERFFSQALGVREDLRDARLGLGYLSLRKSRFPKAEEEFQAVLDMRRDDVQALLGRGVSRFEEAMASTDPIARDVRLRGALDDFENVLKLKPGSSEARFNKVRALYETGLHKQALDEIEAYLKQDPDSIWAARLRDLKTRIQMNRSAAVEKEIFRAAGARDGRLLDNLARVITDKIPAAVITLLRRSLEIEGQPALPENPDSDALEWAARSLASAYSDATGDTSCSRVIDFYGGLSPPKRRNKKVLDARLEQLIGLFAASHFKASILSSNSLLYDFENLKDYWQLVRVCQLRGNSYFYGQTDFAAAEAEYLKMLKYAELTCNPDLIARSLGALAAAFGEGHQYDQALEFLQRLRQLSESHHMDLWSAFASQSRGLTYLKLNQVQESEGEYLSALKLAYRSMDPVVLVQSLENLGVLMERKGKNQEARRLYDEAAKWQEASLKEGLLQSSPETETRRLNLLSKRGYLALQTKDLPAAEALFTEALKPPIGRMQELEARNRIGLAHVHFEERRFQDAEVDVRAALGIALRNQYPEIAWQSNSLQGALLKQRGDSAGALLCFERAADILERMRTNISSVDLRQSFFVRRFDPFREAVSLLYQSQKDPRQALEYADRAKSITLREYLASGLDSARQNGARPAWTPGLKQFGPLPPGMVTLEYFLSSDQVFVFLTGSGNTEAASIPVHAHDLETMVQRYLESIQNNDSNSFEGLSRKLYQTLIEPIYARLESQSPDALVILPDGILHLLPFGSLMDSSGKYFLEKYTLSYAPSRSILQYCLQMKKARRSTRGSSILLMDGTSNLTGASQEIAHIAKVFSNSSRLISSADLASLGAIVGNYEIIHFSGHSNLYRGRPRLVFHSSQGEMHLDSSTIGNWKMRNSQLVTLAGCNTGVGPIFDGETPWGLVPSFLNAGVPTLVVSLLPVDDPTTGSLTSQFYDLLAEGAPSKAIALRQAQLALLKSLGAAARSRPISWAPFVLVGDPR